MSSLANARSKHRTRTRGALRYLDLTYKGGSQPSTQDWSGTVRNVGVAGTESLCHDVVTANFRQLVAAGVVVNNPFSLSESNYEAYQAVDHHRTFSNGSWESITGPVVSWIFGITRPAPPSPEVQDASGRLATLQCWGNVEPAKSQSLVTAFEAHKSWDTIYSRAKSLALVVKHCRSGNVAALSRMLGGASTRRPIPKRFLIWDHDGQPLLSKRGRLQHRYAASLRTTSDSRYLDKASRLWLEYRYGWAPMVYDIIDQLKAVSAPEFRTHLTRDTLRTARGKASRTYQDVIPRTAVAGGLTYTGETRSEMTYTTRAYVHYRNTVAGSFLERLNDFGLFDVPEATWELVPFSFIVDWFVPVGDWLKALTPKIGVEIVAQGFATEQHSVVETVLTGFPSPVVGDIAYSPAAPIGSRDRVTLREKSRQTYLGLPAFPPIDVKLNVKRMADAVALLKGLR